MTTFPLSGDDRPLPLKLEDQPASEPRRPTAPGDAIGGVGRGMVLVVEDDRTVRHLVEEILTEEGYAVSTLDDLRSASIRATVIALEPDCILLDSAGRAEYGESWIEAAWLSARARRVPVIMFSAHAQATREAELRESARSRAAAFGAVLAKPFDLDELIAVVGRSIGKSRSRDDRGCGAIAGLATASGSGSGSPMLPRPGVG